MVLYFPGTFHVVREQGVIGRPCVILGNIAVVGAKRKAPHVAAQDDMDREAQRNTTEEREPHRIARDNLVDATLVFNLGIGIAYGILHVLEKRRRIALPERESQRPEVPHREGEVERGKRKRLGEIALAVALGRIQIHQEVQVEHDLRIEGDSCRVRHDKAFGLARLGTARKATTRGPRRPASNLLLAQSIDANHRGRGKSRKKEDQSKKLFHSSPRLVASQSFRVTGWFIIDVKS